MKFGLFQYYFKSILKIYLVMLCICVCVCVCCLLVWEQHLCEIEPDQGIGGARGYPIFAGAVRWVETRVARAGEGAAPGTPAPHILVQPIALCNNNSNNNKIINNSNLKLILVL